MAEGGHGPTITSAAYPVASAKILQPGLPPPRVASPPLNSAAVPASRATTTLSERTMSDVAFVAKATSRAALFARVPPAVSTVVVPSDDEVAVADWGKPDVFV